MMEDRTLKRKEEFIKDFKAGHIFVDFIAVDPKVTLEVIEMLSLEDDSIDGTLLGYKEGKINFNSVLDKTYQGALPLEEVLKICPDFLKESDVEV